MADILARFPGRRDLVRVRRDILVPVVLIAIGATVVAAIPVQSDRTLVAAPTLRANIVRLAGFSSWA